MSTKTGKKKKQVRLSATERRRAILDAALPLFASRGYRGTTTAAIAEKAGVTEPILYRHFKGKLDLFHVLLVEISGKTAREWEQILAEVAEPFQKLTRIAETFPGMGQRMEDDFRVMLAALTEMSDPVTKKILRNHYEFYADYLGQILGNLEPFKASGLDPEATPFHLINLAVGYALMYPVEIPATNEDTYVQHAIGFLARAVMGGE